MQWFDEFADLEALIAVDPRLYVRYFKGPEHDASGRSLDTESGLELPGLSVNPLNPERWWTRPLGDWVARQLCQYKHLQEGKLRAFRMGVARQSSRLRPRLRTTVGRHRTHRETLGESIGRGGRRYHQKFDAGHGPEDNRIQRHLTIPNPCRR